MIAGVSAVCALGPWVFSEATVLRALAGAAAATAAAGAVVMRRWDTQAGKQVADLTRARASDEWRYEERVAELETDLEESRELRVKLEQRLRAKRTELAGLRNEHAALLRRYATAETQRASALEGRRLLEIEAAVPALPPARSAEREAIEAAPAGAPAAAGAEAPEDAGTSEGSSGPGSAEDTPKACAVFSPEGSRLYLRALTALARFGQDPATGTATDDAATTASGDAGTTSGDAGAARPEAADRPDAPDGETAEPGAVAKGEGAADGVKNGSDAPARGEGGVPTARKGEDEAVSGDEERVRTAAADEHARGTATTVPAEPAKTAGQPPAGHFTVPTAVAVVPAAPARRPVVEGGFDFFGTQKSAPAAALDSVQNEDLADVVGQEALAVHKAEREAAFKPADERSRGIGQVIDLTAHDETEQIDVQGLRSAAS
ncbi:hypothetical protein GCM10010503_42880 [Streptomyces lucensis JCM 4490]|uniref:Secreted protein n=1 Tax=Streptomyces lucensis JCM 4490 TaxID=1306176 RepID=A0A918J8U8_9ACTN|nr:hypothetical protein GCM10010503_42880 [Streptomyces lucensis JCM 4490]